MGLVAYAVAVGVLIDLDHFLIARLRTGTWRATRFCLANPSVIVFDQERIFEEDEVTDVDRLLSHHLIGGLAVGGLVLVDPFLAAVTAVVLYVHVGADLVSDRRDRRERHDRGNETVPGSSGQP